MVKINNRGVNLLDLVVSIFIVGSIILLLMNYLSLQRAALTNGIVYDSLFHASNNVISMIYDEDDWNNVSSFVFDESKRDVVVSFGEYLITPYYTEKMTMTLTVGEVEWIYYIERVTGFE